MSKLLFSGGRYLLFYLLINLLWLSYCSASAPIKSASELDYPPFSIVNSDGSAGGFSVELMQASLQAMGKKVSYSVGPWKIIKQKLEAGKLEALPVVGRSPEREKIFDFTLPYIKLYGAVFVQKSNHTIKNLNDLNDMRIGVMLGDNAEKFIQSKNLGNKLVSYPSYEEALLKLSQNKIDAVVVQRLVGLNLINKLKLENIKTAIAPLKEFRQDFCFAVQEGNKELLAELNEGLSIILTDGTYDRIYNKWLGILNNEQEQEVLFWRQTSSIVTILLFILLINYIYQQRRAYIQLKDSKEKLSTLNQHFITFLDNTTDFIYFKDAKSRILFCSQTLADITNHKSWKDMYGKHDFEIFPEETAQIYYEEELPVFEEGQPLINKTNPYYAADGQKGWVNTNKWPVFNQRGNQVIGIFGISRDITERIHNEQALTTANKRLTALIEALPDAIFFKDGEGRWLITNESAKKLFNLHEISWQGKTEKELALLRPQFKAAHNKCDADDEYTWAQAQLSFFEEEIIDAEGNLHIYDVRKIPLFDTENKREGLVAIGRDITELRQAISRLELAANVFTHAREGIIITNDKGSIVDVNDAFLQITGYQREDVIAHNPSILSSNRHGIEFYQAMWTALVQKGHWSGEIWNKRKNGEVYAEMLTISSVKNSKGKVSHYVGLFSDITEQKEHQHQLEHIAHYDALTNLPNRMLLADRMHQAMNQSKRRATQLAVVYLDLDGFKAINDNYGHEVGDQLLIKLATRMKKVIRNGDTIARLGGDEFVAVLLDLDNGQTGLSLINRLLQAVAKPVHKNQIIMQVSASLGVTYYPQNEEMGADQLLRQADQAMYQAKLAGKNRFHIFDATHDRNVRGHHKSLENIKSALNNDEFVLYYQPKVNMYSGEVIGVEALIRWRHPEQGILPPAVFLPTIENDILSIKLGNWVIDNALSQLEIWQAAGLNIPVSVNVSAIQLQDAKFISQLETLLAAHQSINPTLLELEVLETSALEDIVKISEIMHACKKMGISFALDDFGTGYSSLTYFKRLPATTLKIDQSFVRDMLDDPEDLAILEGVLGLGAAFRRNAIAEGVETVEHGNLLLQLGCKLAQGYGIARPMPVEQLINWVNSWRPPPSWKNQHPVSRDELPLLFALVEHRAWIRTLEEYLKGERSHPPPLDQNQCRFGIWLNDEAKRKHGNNPAFKAIVGLHGEIHTQASQLLQFKSIHNRTQIFQKLEALCELRDKLLEQMQELLNECRR
jgi:diguanylate cyclase (GGDEF)-like protein/PAS domain S-box-containing protein